MGNPRTVLVILLCLVGIGCQAINNDPVLSSWDKPAPKAKALLLTDFADK